MPRAVVRTAAIGMALVMGGGLAPAAAPRERAAQRQAAAESAVAFGALIRAEIEAALKAIDDGHDYEQGAARLGELFDAVIAYGDAEGDADLFEDAAFAARLARQAAAAGPEVVTPAIWGMLRGNDALARSMVFAVDEQRDKVREVYALLGRIRAAHQAAVVEHPQLTAAVCVVFDERLVRHMNENHVEAGDPVELWGYYAEHAKRMVYPFDSTPVELLVYVVSNPAPIDEVRWAMKQHAGDTQVGRRYHDIAYDYAHLGGEPKIVTERGYSLPNIRQYGGVCIDQAYYAEVVGKSIGVPTVTARARGTDVGHAWVGYLQRRGKGAVWNFDEGCWDDYKKLIGRVEDPQTGRDLGDGDVELLAEMIGTSVDGVHRAAAFTDAARRLRAVSAEDAAFPPAKPSALAPEEADALGDARAATLAAQLDLARAALKGCAGYRPAWEFVRECGSDGSMSLAQKKEWSSLFDELSRGGYASFMVSFMAPMIESVESPADQLAMWERLYERVKREPEIAAGVCMRLGEEWEEAGKKSKAYECYRVVVIEHVDDGAFALEALARCERMLAAEGRMDVLAELLGEAFRRCSRPTLQSPFASGSVWSRIGAKYAATLAGLGRQGEAGNVQRQLDSQREQTRGRGR